MKSLVESMGWFNETPTMYQDDGVLFTLENGVSIGVTDLGLGKLDTVAMYGADTLDIVFVITYMYSRKDENSYFPESMPELSALILHYSKLDPEEIVETIRNDFPTIEFGEIPKEEIS